MQLLSKRMAALFVPVSVSRWEISDEMLHRRIAELWIRTILFGEPCIAATMINGRFRG